MFSHPDPWQCFYQEVANLLFKVLTFISKMQQNAPFCVLPTAFSLSRVVMYVYRKLGNANIARTYIDTRYRMFHPITKTDHYQNGLLK